MHAHARSPSARMFSHDPRARSWIAFGAAGQADGDDGAPMHGSYRMIADDSTLFDALIPAFVLLIPRTLH